MDSNRLDRLQGRGCDGNCADQTGRHSKGRESLSPIAKELNLPIRYVGVGEQVNDSDGFPMLKSYVSDGLFS
jgi:hypothetical protein